MSTDDIPEILYTMLRRPYVGDSGWIYTAVCGFPHEEGEGMFSAKGGESAARESVRDHLKGKHGIDLRRGR